MDLLEAIAEDQGFEYEIRPLGFNAALQAVESGQVDGMIAGMGITEERQESFDFSDPYYEAGVQFAVLEDSDIESLEDLEGENVAVKTGTTGMAAAESVADEYGFTISTFEEHAEPIAGAGYDVFSATVGHLAVLVATAQRANGYGTFMLARVAEECMFDGLIPQWVIPFGDEIGERMAADVGFVLSGFRTSVTLI